MIDRTYHFDELDSTEEIVKEMQLLRDQVVRNEASTKVNRSKIDVVEELLSRPKVVNKPKKTRPTRPKVVNKPKKTRPKKKKGFVSMKVLVGIVVALMLFAGTVFAANITFEEASTTEGLVKWINDNINVGFYSFTPRTSAPAGSDLAEGVLYYNDTSNALYLSTDGSTFTALATGISVSLDQAYNAGNELDVDGSAVTLTTSDGDNNVVLAVAQNEATNDNAAMTITMGAGATGNGLTIDSQSTGTDIAGDNWSVSQAGVLAIKGITNTAADVTLTGTNYNVVWDTSESDLEFADNAVLEFGTGADVLIAWDETDLDITAAADESVIKWGNGTNDFDMWWYGGAAGDYMLWDEGAALLTFVDAHARFNDDGTLAFGTGADFTVYSDTANTLEFDPATAGATIKLGTAHSDAVDVTWYSDTENHTVSFDEENCDVDFANIDLDLDDDSYLRFGSSDDITIKYDGTGDDLNILGSGKEIAFGVTDEGIDVVFHGETDGANVMWDESADQFLGVGGAQISLNDSVELLFGTGAANAGDFSITGNGTGPVLVIDVISAGSGSIEIGNDADDVPMKWFAETTSDWVYFNADECEFEDVVLQLMDDTEVQFGDGDDAILRYDETTDDNFEIAIASSGMSIVADDFIITTDGATANQIKFDATGTAANVDAIVLETTSGGIQLNADDTTNGDIEINANDDMELTATGDIIVTVGGDFCIVDDDVLSFGTTDDITINYDEDGEDNLQINGPVDMQTTYVEFRENPMCTADAGGGAATGTAGDENILISGNPATMFEYHIIGTATAVAPVIGAEGLDIGLDDAENDGIEVTEGITARSHSAFTVGTDAFYLEIKIYVTDADGSDEMLIGFRADEAYQADPEDYTDMAAVALCGVDFYTYTIDDDGATTKTDVTRDDAADTTAYTIRVNVAANRAVTYEVNGAEPGDVVAHSIDDGDVVIPFLYLIHDSTTAEGFQIVSWECGLQ